MKLFRRLALNRIDLIAGVVAIAIVIVAGIVIWTIPESVNVKSAVSDKDIAAALLGGWVAILLAMIGGAIKITSTRQSLIRLFVSEIKALQFGLSNMEMFESWRELYDKPERGPTGFADAPRQENYFQYFDALGDNIGNLHPNVVEAVVRFYTYLKMSRDAAAKLHGWDHLKDIAERRVQVRQVVNLLTQSMLWGFVALWFMGFEAGEQERDFLLKIEATFNAVFGADATKSLREQHVRRAALERFFE